MNAYHDKSNNNKYIRLQSQEKKKREPIPADGKEHKFQSMHSTHNYFTLNNAFEQT